MAAYALAEHTSLDRVLSEQINNAPTKADFLHLNAPIEVVQKARDELKDYIGSGAQYNKDAFYLILKEVEYLADPNT